MTPSLSVTSAPSPEDLAVVGNNLTAFNEGEVGASNRLPLAVFVRDEAGRIVAGISGYTGWGWLYVQWLWVGEELRGHGWAGTMLSAAEDEARVRGCHGAYIDTFNPVALRTYERAGYKPFGTLPEFPPGRTRTFLQKSLLEA